MTEAEAFELANEIDEDVECPMETVVVFQSRYAPGEFMVGLNMGPWVVDSLEEWREVRRAWALKAGAIHE